MRLLEGTKIADAPADWRPRIDAHGRHVVIDVGAGDGRYVYETARRDPESLYIGVDPDAAALTKYAYRAARKPARGGVENAMYVVASLAQLPADLDGLADVVRINFPWAGLLRAVLRPEQDALVALAGLVRQGGRFEVVLTYDPTHDAAAVEGESLPLPDERYIDQTLAPAYAAADIEITARRRLTREEALAIPSTWGRRLLHGRPRDVWLIEARCADNALGLSIS